jgi:glycosyltransferase involved in cell wall biosynthesis
MRILFLWSQCILDRGSGFALSLKTLLELLAQAGHECHSMSMMLFDGDKEFPLTRLLDADSLSEGNQGRVLQADHRGVRHYLFYTKSTLGKNLTLGEASQFLGDVKATLGRLDPQVILTSSDSQIARHLHQLAAQTRARRIFCLATANYSQPELFADFDAIWCPTKTLADHYQDRLGIHAHAIRDVFNAKQFVDPASVFGCRKRFITFINPSPEKGAVLVFALARLAARERPDLQFLIVESRVRQEHWRGWGLNPGALPNVHWVRNRADMRPVWRRTSLLLFPSYWFEAAGRGIVEAQLSGIPVLASRRGGIPEQMNGGGFLFDLPPRCVQDINYLPTDEEVRPWFDCIRTLLDNDAAYAAARERAMAAAAPFRPEACCARVQTEFLALFNGQSF